MAQDWASRLRSRHRGAVACRAALACALTELPLAVESECLQPPLRNSKATAPKPSLREPWQMTYDLHQKGLSRHAPTANAAS